MRRYQPNVAVFFVAAASVLVERDVPIIRPVETSPVDHNRLGAIPTEATQGEYAGTEARIRSESAIAVVEHYCVHFPQLASPGCSSSDHTQTAAGQDRPRIHSGIDVVHHLRVRDLMLIDHEYD